MARPSLDMYTPLMRRIQIYMDDELDERLQAEARKMGTSKASLIRESVAARYATPRPIGEEGISRLVGRIDVDPASVNDVVYPR